jgi:DNA-directed RNA polymerase specialized sigma subunit
MSSEKEASKRREQDELVWRKWDQTRRETGVENNEHFSDLYKRMAPAAHKFVRTYAGKTEIPEPVLEVKAKEGMLEGIRTWNPSHSSGAALFSFVTTTINNRTRRFVQERQGPVRIPEHRGWSKITEFNSAIEEFEAERNHEPSDQELAQYMNWPLAHVQRMRRDLLNSAPGIGKSIQENVSIQIPKEDMALSELRYQLQGGTPGDQQKLRALELFQQGMNGQQVAMQLGIGESKVSQIRRELVKRLGRELGRRR